MAVEKPRTLLTQLTQDIGSSYLAMLQARSVLGEMGAMSKHDVEWRFRSSAGQEQNMQDNIQDLGQPGTPDLALEQSLQCLISRKAMAPRTFFRP